MNTLPSSANSATPVADAARVASRPCRESIRLVPVWSSMKQPVP
jgi:hypothetical protein